jgi:hypothetical protein
MKPIHAIVAVLLLPAIAYSDERASSQRVVASLRLPHATVLPGVPFDMTVEMKNVSAQTVTAGIGARLRVTLPDGTNFSPEKYALLEPQDVEHRMQNYVELAPGESRDWAITWWFGTPSWAHYDAYSAPGTYDIALELTAYHPPENYVGPIITSTARLHRAVAPGEDEALWKRMQAVRNCSTMYSTDPPRQICTGGWSDDGFMGLKEGLEIAKEIRELHPASQYYPYAILLQFQNETNISKILDAADRFLDSPAYPYLLLLAGGCAESAAIKAERNNEADAVEKDYALAGRLYGDVLKKTSNVALRQRAQRGVFSVQTRGRTVPVAQ